MVPFIVACMLIKLSRKEMDDFVDDIKDSAEEV